MPTCRGSIVVQCSISLSLYSEAPILTLSHTLLKNNTTGIIQLLIYYTVTILQFKNSSQK